MVIITPNDQYILTGGIAKDAMMIVFRNHGNAKDVMMIVIMNHGNAKDSMLGVIMIMMVMHRLLC